MAANRLVLTFIAVSLWLYISAVPARSQDAAAPVSNSAFDQACANGSGEACRLRGRLLMEGAGGVRENDTEALRSYEAGCALNDIEACALIGYMAWTGQGMPTSAAVAVRQYLTGCRGGIEFACTNLSIIRNGGPDFPGNALLASLERPSGATGAEEPARPAAPTPPISAPGLANTQAVVVVPQAPSSVQISWNPYASAPGSPGLRCLYDTVGAERMQAYNAQLDDGTLTVDQLSELITPASRACVERGMWAHQHQLNESWGYATDLAWFVDAGQKLQSGGVDPDAVLQQWDAMPLALRDALRLGTDIYVGGRDQFTTDMRAFLVARTPANISPNIGMGFELYSAYAKLLLGQQNYDAPPPVMP